jgi:pyruvate,water dikinase
LAIEHLAERWELGGQVYFLHLDELAGFPRRASELGDRLASRRVRWEAWGRLEMPPIVDSQHLDDLGLSRPASSATSLDAIPVASGVVTGMAQVIHAADQAGDLGGRAILVCPAADPGWTPLFLAASGLVVERGGILSHGAMVARDLGLPAVVCADATRRLQTGDRIRVDGNQGRIEVLGREAGNARVVE